MTFVTTEQRLEWGQPINGIASVLQDITAALIASQKVNTGLLEDNRDPELQAFTKDEIAAWRAAFDAVVELANSREVKS